MALVTRSASIHESESNPYRPTNESPAVALTTKEPSTTANPLTTISEEDLVAVEATITRLTRLKEL